MSLKYKVIIYLSYLILSSCKYQTKNELIEELSICYSINDVQKIWENKKYRDELNKDTLYDIIARKLSKFSLSETKLRELRKWFPPRNVNVNLIIIPDLSNRIDRTGTIKEDQKVLKHIWETFLNNIIYIEDRKKRLTAKDELMIDITDKEGSAWETFHPIADSLIFDKETFNTQKGKILFTNRFEKNISLLYDVAQKNHIGADYAEYITKYLPELIKDKKNTVTDDYIHKIIILTDGYLEPNEKISYTPVDKIMKILKKDCDYDIVKDCIDQNTSFIQDNINNPTDIFLNTNIQIFVYGIDIRNEHKKPKGLAKTILEVYWEEWFKALGVDKDDCLDFYEKGYTRNWKQKIEEFIDRKPNKY